MCVYNRMLNFVIILFVFHLLPVKASSESSLQLVHILFRHGDRTTDARTLYPKDPHINETYYPYGRGELTNKGKQNQYKLGKLLRQRYDDFLGEIYTPDMLEAQSSDVNRTKVSLQLVLAGLFPPAKEQIWETGLNWQPIPFTTLPVNQDTLFFGLACPGFQKIFSNFVSSPRMVGEFGRHAENFRYISENSGLNVRNYWDTFYLYLCLTTEREYGFVLPEWTKKVYPQSMRDYAIKSYNLFTATTEMRRYVSGTLLKKIVTDSQGKINNQPPFKNRKLFLYSGHEFNLAYLLHTLDVFEPHLPPYGSFIAFELHNINGTNGFKIFYHNYSQPQPELLKLPACDEFCPLDEFISLLEEYLPEKNVC